MRQKYAQRAWCSACGRWASTAGAKIAVPHCPGAEWRMGKRTDDQRVQHRGMRALQLDPRVARRAYRSAQRGMRAYAHDQRMAAEQAAKAEREAARAAPVPA